MFLLLILNMKCLLAYKINLRFYQLHFSQTETDSQHLPSLVLYDQVTLNGAHLPVEYSCKLRSQGHSSRLATLWLYEV